MKFEIVCDSASDLPKAYTDEAGVAVVPFYVSFDSEKFYKEGRDIPVEEFYKAMAEHEDCFPSTSMPSVQDYIDAFMPFVEKKMPVLCICITKKFSGSMQSAMNAKMTIEDDYPDAEIYVMDSELVTALEGLFVKEAVRLRDLDYELKEAVEKLEGIRSSGHIFFTTKDLKYLEHGGRIGKAACVAGSMLNLKPILQFSDGELGSAEVCRGRKRSLQKVIDKFMTYLETNNIDLKGYWFGTGIGLDVPEYKVFMETLEKRFEEKGIHPDEWVKIQIGSTIGVHTGPYPVGLGFLKKCEV